MARTRADRLAQRQRQAALAGEYGTALDQRTHARAGHASRRAWLAVGGVPNLQAAREEPAPRLVGLALGGERHERVERRPSGGALELPAISQRKAERVQCRARACSHVDV